MFIKSKSGKSYLLTDREAIVTFNSTVTSLGDIGKIKKEKVEGGDANIKQWGINNDSPSKREELLRTNTIPPALISTKRNLVTGLDFFCYEELYVKNDATGKTERVINEIETPPEVLEFHHASGGNAYFRNAANELFINANVFTEFLTDIGTAAGTTAKRYVAVKLQPSRYIRAEQMDDDGTIPNYYWRGDGWVKRTDEKRIYVARRIAAYDMMLGEEQDPSGFLYHTGDSLFTDEYYFIPTWEGSHKWIQLAGIIADFHQANLKHGYTIRYHVEINSDLLDDGVNAPDYDPTDAPDREAKREDEKQAILQSVNDFLAGHDKAGRAVISEFRIDHNGKEINDLKITPMKVDLKDSALLELWVKANEAMMSGFQVHPVLANIETQGRLSSGTEMRNAYLMWLAVHGSTYRDILLEPYYLAKRLNGWNPKLKFGFRDALLTTLAEKPTGTKNGTPTA